MKTYKEFIAERNPYHPGKMTIEKFEPFLKNGYYMSFTELRKVGINPRSKYSTPHGLYTYPLYAKEFIRSFEAKVAYADDEYGVSESDKFLGAITKSVPFMGDNPNYLYVVRENPSANVYHTSRGDYTWDDIKSSSTLTVLEKYVSKSVTVDMDEFNEIISGEVPVPVMLRGNREVNFFMDTPSGHLANDDMEPLCFIWGLTRWITGGQDNRSMRMWGQCLQELGIDGISDDAAIGLIHSAEPFQAVFFKTGVLKPVAEIPLKKSSESKSEASAARDFNVAMKILKSGRMPKKMSKVLLDSLSRDDNPYPVRDVQRMWYALLMSDNEAEVYDTIYHVSKSPNLMPGFLPAPVMEIVQRDDVFVKNPDALTMLLPGYKKFATPFARKHICKSVDIPRELVSKFDDGYPQISPDDLPAIKEYLYRDDFQPDDRGWQLLAKGGAIVHAIGYLALADDQKAVDYLKIHPKAIEYLPENKFSKKLVVALLREQETQETLGKYIHRVITFKELDDGFSGEDSAASRMRILRFIFGLLDNKFLSKKEKAEQVENINELLLTPVFSDLTEHYMGILKSWLSQITK